MENLLIATILTSDTIQFNDDIYNEADNFELCSIDYNDQDGINLDLLSENDL